jgi:thioredoxin reductase (NADPH)
MERTEVAIVGAGPIGLELAVTLKLAGIDYLHFEKRQIGQTIYWFPPATRFFSSNDRLAIAGIPIQTVDQSKATREDYLAYLRTVATTYDLAVRTYERVTGIERTGGGDFVLTTRRSDGEHRYAAGTVVLTTGGTARPRMLGIPGEDLPHVSHYFHDPHVYFRKHVLIVGGKNSAVEAALRCYHAGAHVAMSYRRARFDPHHIKYWLLPELEGRIQRGEIACHYSTEPVTIAPAHVTLRRGGGEAAVDVPADFVLLMVGYVADMSLFRAAGVTLEGPGEAPVYNEETMETSVPGLYVAGTAVAGSQTSYRVFIENCHVHAERIRAALTGAPPPRRPQDRLLPES